MRAVLDPCILISALLSRGGAPAQVLTRWLGGEFELIVSESLLDELARALAYPRLRERIPAAEAADQYLLELGGRLPIQAARGFLDTLQR